jgi:hypothetical protein
MKMVHEAPKQPSGTAVCSSRTCSSSSAASVGSGMSCPSRMARSVQYTPSKPVYLVAFVVHFSQSYHNIRNKRPTLKSKSKARAVYVFEIR